jgi:uncharacterized protein (DUF849 family)
VLDIYNHTRKEFVQKFVMVHSFPDMVYIAETMKACGVKPELECYDMGMINNAKFLAELGHLVLNYADRYLVQLYLGSISLGLYTAGYKNIGIEFL